MARKTDTPTAPKSDTTASTTHARAYLLTGTETGRKRAEAKALSERFVDPGFADFDTETLDGNNALAESVLGGALAVPMGVGKRVVTVRDTQQMDGDEQRKLANGLGNIPVSGVLILLTGAPIIEEGRAKRQSIVLPELAKAVKEKGSVLDFGVPKAEELRDYLKAKASETGKSLASDAAALLLQLSGDDLRRVGTEIAKAAAHAGDAKTITAADVEATLSRSPDDVIFKLCDAVGMRRTQEAIAHTNTLFRSGARPDGVAARALVMLARQIRYLAQFRYLNDKKLTGRNAPPIPHEIAALLPSDGAGSMIGNGRSGWMAEKYASQARNFSGAEIAERMEKLLAADLALKGVQSGGDNPQAILQKLVVELC